MLYSRLPRSVAIALDEYLAPVLSATILAVTAARGTRPGQCRRAGSREYNIALGQRRAEGEAHVG